MRTSPRPYKRLKVHAKHEPKDMQIQTTRSKSELRLTEPRGFNKLPPEVRTMIWHLASEEDETRLVRMKWLNRKHPFPVMRLDSGPVPSLLQVNKESRAEMQRIYRQVKDHYRSDIGFEKVYSKKPYIVDRYTYINFTKDIIYYDPKCYDHLRTLHAWALNLAQGKAIISADEKYRIAHIRHVAIPLQAYKTTDSTPIAPKFEPVIQTCLSHPYLESLSLVFDKSDFFTLRTRGKPAPGPHSYSLMDIHLGTDLSGLVGDWRTLCRQRNKLFLREAQGFGEITDLKNRDGESVPLEWKACKEFLDRYPQWIPPTLVVKGLAYADDDEEEMSVL